MGSDNDEDSYDNTYSASMRAGEFRVEAEGADTEEAVAAAESLWDKGIEDINEMDPEEREQIHLQ